MVHLCANRFLVFQMDAKNLMGLVNCGSSRLKLNALARELFWFGLEHQITLLVEWVPREENTLAYVLSKMLIPDDFVVRRTHFRRLELRFGAHTIDLHVRIWREQPLR